MMCLTFLFLAFPLVPGHVPHGLAVEAVDLLLALEHGPGNLIGNLEAKKSNLQNLLNLKQNRL